MLMTKSIFVWPTARSKAAAMTFVAMVAGISLSGCANGSGPVQSISEQGRPVVDNAGAPVLPGQPVDGTAAIVNTGSQPVTLLSAALVPVPGYRAGVLSHLAVGTTHDMVTPGRGWPPGIPVRPFAGAKIAHGQADVIFGMTGAEVNKDYAVAGIRIMYRANGQDYSVVAWFGLEGCVIAKSDDYVSASDSCNDFGNKFLGPLDKAAGVS
jgi:hypothetical protein